MEIKIINYRDKFSQYIIVDHLFLTIRTQVLFPFF